MIELKTSRKGTRTACSIHGLTVSIPAGGIVGMIGPNGAGKTTLLRLITGQEVPDMGYGPGRRDSPYGVCRPEP